MTSSYHVVGSGIPAPDLPTPPEPQDVPGDAPVNPPPETPNDVPLELPENPDRDAPLDSPGREQPSGRFTGTERTRLIKVNTSLRRDRRRHTAEPGHRS